MAYITNASYGYTPPQGQGPESYAGFSATDIANYLGLSADQVNLILGLQNGNLQSLSGSQAQQLNDLYNQPVSGSPSGASNRLDDIYWGLNQLQQHPAGSKYHGDFNLGDIHKNLLTAGTAGIFDFRDGFRVNVPFSGAQVRAGGESSINALTAGQAKDFARDFTHNDFAMQVTPYVGMAGAAATGYGIGSELGAMYGAAGTGASSGGMLGGALGGLAGRFANPAGGPQLDAGGGTTGAAGGGQGLTPQQIAALSAMQSEPHKGLAPTFEQRAKNQPVSPGLAGQGWTS